MTETMVERVARAIVAAIPSPSQDGVAISAEGLARAAIKAMREPTFDPDMVSYHRGMTRRDWWSAMISAALSEPTTRERGEQ